MNGALYDWSIELVQTVEIGRSICILWMAHVALRGAGSSFAIKTDIST